MTTYPDTGRDLIAVADGEQGYVLGHIQAAMRFHRLLTFTYDLCLSHYPEAMHDGIRAAFATMQERFDADQDRVRRQFAPQVDAIYQAAGLAH